MSKPYRIYHRGKLREFRFSSIQDALEVAVYRKLREFEIINSKGFCVLEVKRHPQ